MSGFGVYIHWPFCAAKCPYCDFNSHVRQSYDEAAWIDAIGRELGWIRSQQDDAPRVGTVFFGGGTPSLMSGKAVARVLEHVHRLWPMANDCEVTLEANPASADAGHFADYRAAGVNRLSVGMQALNDADLKFLGRLHTVTEGRAALKAAMEVFDRVSLDLIYARPEQSIAAWRAELRDALAFGTEHLSLYQLTIEPQTPFAALARTGRLHIPDDEHAAALYDLTQEMCEAAGRPAYEISNHAASGAECRHNLLYWRYGDYAGAGPGAHGRITACGKRIATVTEKLPERWLQTVAERGEGIAEQSPIAPEDAAREHLVMNLRLREGLDLEDFTRRWNWKPDEGRIIALVQDGFLARERTRIAATAKGRLVLNRVIAELAN